MDSEFNNLLEVVEVVDAEVKGLLDALNNYTGDNVFQEVIYASEVVDIEATAEVDGLPTMVILTDGTFLMFDERQRQWVRF